MRERAREREVARKGKRKIGVTSYDQTQLRDLLEASAPAVVPCENLFVYAAVIFCAC